MKQCLRGLAPLGTEFGNDGLPQQSRLSPLRPGVSQALAIQAFLCPWHWQSCPLPVTCKGQGTLWHVLPPPGSDVGKALGLAFLGTQVGEVGGRS